MPVLNILSYNPINLDYKILSESKYYSNIPDINLSLKEKLYLNHRLLQELENKN